MKKLLRRRPSPALVVATIALFVALGGGATAASHLLTGADIQNNTIASIDIKNGTVNTNDIKNGTVNSKDIKNNSVRTLDVRDGSLLAEDFKSGELLTTDSLPSGHTVRGAFNMGGTAAAPTHLANTSISFVFALAAPPTVNLVPAGQAPPAACPGTATFPEAEPGNLCIYEFDVSNTTGMLLNGVNRAGSHHLHPVSWTGDLLQLRHLGRYRTVEASRARAQ